jgi:hypothetical protein
VKKYLFIFLFIFGLAYQGVNAQLLGFKDPSGCSGNDPFLPTLLVCGRNPQSGACPQYTNPCSLGDFVETGRRAIIWMISFALLCIPILFTYYGAMIMWNGKMDGGVVNLKDLKEKMYMLVIYFICLLGAWLVVKLVVDTFQVNDRINTFMIDANGNKVKAMPVNLNR